jgi:pectinesterase|tara:strand:+ start:56641 stop:57627 length:987 start_codon:yes stop_codon:yes gene_type:complete
MKVKRMSNRTTSFLLTLISVFLFTEVFAQGYETEFIVSQDGSGDYTSIQAAIDGAKSYPYERITIYVRDGVYKEKVKVHAWNTKLSIIGESKENTIITFSDYFDSVDRGRNSTFHTYTFLVDANDFHAENLTIENSAGEVGQAVALHVEGDRVSFENCNLLGNQDTVYLAGEGNRNYFRNCYIEGTTDFIFGGATAYFEDSEIYSKSNSYITAASTPENQEYGFVFQNCSLTAAEGIDEVYLGRPWRNFAQTVFLNTRMGSHILPEGWDNWGKAEAESSAFYGEFSTKGPGANSGKRVDWSHQLTKKQAENYTKERVFGNWDPEIESQ